MTTSEILNTNDYSEYYNFCEYLLSAADFVFIKSTINNSKEIFSVTKFYHGTVELSEIDEDGCPIKFCNIQYTQLKVYNDGEAYLQISEKHSDEIYEVKVNQDYIEENIKDIMLENPLEVIQTILAKDISDSKKIKEIKNIIKNN